MTNNKNLCRLNIKLSRNMNYLVFFFLFFLLFVMKVFHAIFIANRMKSVRKRAAKHRNLVKAYCFNTIIHYKSVIFCVYACLLNNKETNVEQIVLVSYVPNAWFFFHHFSGFDTSCSSWFRDTVFTPHSHNEHRIEWTANCKLCMCFSITVHLTQQCWIKYIIVE